MNETTENDHNKVLSPAFHAAWEIRRSKANDYGGIKEYFPFGDTSYVQMIHIKTKRLINLNKHAGPVNHESIKDNLLDLINYASYYYEWLEGVLDE